MGLDAAGPDELAAWVNRRFTRGNAALWLAGGPPPAKLRLDLPDGGRTPVPAMPVTIRSSPAYFNAHMAGPGFCGLVRRSTAAQVYGKIFPSRLNAELRHTPPVPFTRRVTDSTHTSSPARHDAVPRAAPDPAPRDYDRNAHPRKCHGADRLHQPVSHGRDARPPLARRRRTSQRRRAAPDFG
jgi:hypothetical protein